MDIKSTSKKLAKRVRRLFIRSTEILYAYNLFEKSQYWSKKQHEEYQLKKLKQLVENAYQYVPYYKKLFDKHSITPDDIQGLDDIRKIPFLTKETVRKNVDDLISTKYKKEKLLRFTTGGTTNKPMPVYQCNYNRVLGRAVQIYWHKYVGLDYLKDRQVSLAGAIIPEDLIRNKQYWLIKGNHLLLSAFHISNETCSSYVKILNEFKPNFIRAHPSAISLLAKYISKNRLELNSKLDAIVVDAETLHEEQKKFLISIFKCPIYNDYGHNEHSVWGIPCNKSDYFHILPEFGICELIKPNGEVATEEGEKGEIVVTGLACRAMPFIRYKTGDIGILTKKKCDCGRNYMLLKSIEGRIQDYIIGLDNTLIPLGPLLFEPPLPNPLFIKMIQIYQDTPGKILLRVVKEKSCSKTSQNLKDYLLNLYIPKLGNNCEIGVEFVSDIPLTARGKHKYIKQKLDIQSFM